MLNSTIKILLLSYAIIIFAVAMIGRKKGMTLKELNTGGGEIHWILIGLSISATWIWAPALFVASERAFLDGILGILWFVVPNIIALILFGYVASKAMRKSDKKQPLSSLMGEVYNSEKVKKIYNFELLILSVFSIGVQLLAGGLVLHTITGYDFTLMTGCLAVFALSYSLLSGIKGSVNTDVAQMVIMISAVIIAIYSLSHFDIVSFGGVNEVSTSLFSKDNYKIFLLYGLTTSIGLLSGPVADQTFWQRISSMNKKSIFKSITLASIIFAIVPIGMSVIGLMASSNGFIPDDSSMVGLEFIAQYTSPIVLSIFLICIVAGLSSTLDSHLCSTSSIITDMSERTKKVKYGRYGMVIITIIGLFIANIPNLDIFWLFLFYGVLRSSVAIPTIYTMVTRNMIEGDYIYNGILGSFLIAIPMYAVGAIFGIWVLTFSGTLLTWIIPIIFIARGHSVRSKKIC